jgi:hypothetical protein
VRSGGVERLWWSGRSTTPQGASPKQVGAPGPAEEERGRLVRSGDGESIMKTGRKLRHPYRRTVKQEVRTKCTGEVFFYSCEHQDGQDGSGWWLVLEQRERARAGAGVQRGGQR